MNDLRDRQLMDLVDSSALWTLVSRGRERLDMAWTHSTARRVSLALGQTLADRRGAATTAATAAVVALVMQWISPVAEPGLWMVPAAALLWAVATLVRTAGSQ